jgi:DNA-binding CsgD family transcriptional regulator/sugar-specific transcriptional regulator TrmB
MSGLMLDVLGLDQVAEDVYRAMLADRAHGVDDLRRILDLSEHQVRSALDALFERALVRRSADRADAWRAVDPQVGFQTLLARQQAELEQRRARIATAQAEVAVLIAERLADEPADGGQTRRLPGIDTVISRLEQLAEIARTEILGITPGGAQAEASLAAARRNDGRLLERGVAIREVVQDSCRNDPATAAHARWLTEAGGQVRTAPVLPHRMILIDARIAIVPLDPEDSSKGALQVTDPGIVGTLHALFDRIWDSATPLGATAAPGRHGLTTRERELLRLLACGLTDEAAAARLAVSDRTVRRIMNELCERLNAASRFEAGIKAAQAGWLA